jgi:hypothetical protein
MIAGAYNLPCMLSCDYARQCDDELAFRSKGFCSDLTG